ncbi:MAG: DUF4272 domain-containing protein [Acidobacteria bacterium]|nr:DUF4272 domain-containing protein [Acidobacteriota bacterium]
MSSLINVYSPLNAPILPPAPIVMHRHYPASADGFVEHLTGFVQYIESLGQPNAPLIRHIMRSQQRYSVHTDPAPGPNLWAWVKQVSGILFYPDGNVLDPFGRTLVHPDPTRLSSDAAIPYSESSLSRKKKNEAVLKAMGIASSLLPLPDGAEIRVRAMPEIWQRAQAAGVVGLRVLAWKQKRPFTLPVKLLERDPGLTVLKEQERAFVLAKTLDPKLLLNFSGHEEFAFTLAWALDLHAHIYLKEKADPDCTWLQYEPQSIRSVDQILDQADLYARVYALAQLEPSEAFKIQSRWEALVWLCQMSDWDCKIGF